MGRSHGFSPEQSYEGNISTSNDYVDLQGNVPPFEYRVILDIRERKTALKKLAKQLQITSGDPEYGQLRDKVLELGVVPKALEENPTYDINGARKWYGLSEYLPPVESPDPEEGNESRESTPHEMTWQKPRNENGGEPDPRQQPGHIRLTNNEFKNELTLGKGDKESGRDPSTYIIPTFGRLLGIPEGDDKGALEYKLRLAIEANDKNIPEELQRGELTPENRNIWRQKIKLEPLNLAQTETEEEQQGEADNVENLKLTREDFGPMPEDPYDIDINTDLKALNSLFESNQSREAFPDGQYINVREWADWSPISVEPKDSKWYILKGNSNDIVGEFGTKEEAETEFNRIKDEDKQKALDLIRMARNFAIGVSLESPWEEASNTGESLAEVNTTNFPVEELETRQEGIVFTDKDISKFEFNISRFSGNDEKKLAIIIDDLEELGLTEEEIEGYISQKGIPNIPSESIRIGDKRFDWWDRHPSGYTYKEIALSQYYGFNLFDNLTEGKQDESVPTSETNPSVLNPETQIRLDKLPGAEVFWQELNDLANSIAERETGGKLARIEGEISPGEGELETLDKSAEIEQLKQEAREAIQKYKEFGDTHAPNLRTESVQNVYRQLETDAWDKVEELSHKLDGHLSRELPQLRDILTAHRDLTNISDAKYSLVSTKNIKLNTEGNITHIVDNEGNEVELNRPRTFEEIFAKSRPVRVLYNIDNENKKLGYIIEGLNLNTPDWIEGVLNDKEFLEPIIVDPWDTPIEYILPNTETESSLYPIDKTPKLTPAEELSNVQVKENIGDTSKQDEKLETNSKAQLDNLRTAYARAEELHNRNRNDESAKLELERLRGEYNQTVEEVIGIMAAQGLGSEIHAIFTQEVKNLREERILQSQELQSGFEKAINPLKEKFVNFAIKHKKIISRLNLVAFGVGTTLALTGFGLPVAGGLAVLRRSVSSLMSGVSSRELARAGFEDGDINLFKGKIKWQAAIPKLVGESLQEGYIKKANDADLSTKLSTLEAYYRLNGGKFTNESQQTAYESILNELGSRVQQENIINQSEKEVNPTTTQEVKDETINSENSNSDEGEVKAQPEKFVFSSLEQNQQYTNKLLTVLSEKRITELQKQQQKRKTADIIGFVAGGSLLTIGTLLDANRANLASQNTIETAPPAPDLPTPEELDSGKGIAKEVTQNLSAEQIKDISELSSGETLIGEITKKLGANATEEQIQQGLETYMHTSQGSETIFNLASQTEAGKALLSQLGIDKAQELSQLPNTDLYKITQHLGTGQLKGLDSLDLSNISANNMDTFPGTAASPIGEIPLSPTANPEQLWSKLSQAPDFVELARGTRPLDVVNGYIANEVGNLSYDSTLGQEVLNAYIGTPAGKNWLYDAIVSNPNPNNQNVQLFREYLSFKGIKSAEDFNQIFNWAEFSSDHKIPTSGFWKPVKLPNTNNIIQPLSTFLQPSKMTGIREAVRQVLTR
jgi:hypothetical protein